jgi:hypothetical protein
MKLCAIIALVSIALTAPPAAAATNGATVTLRPVGSSSESGTADIMRTSEGSKVFIHIFAGVPAGAQPARIVSGTCENFAGASPRFILDNIAGAKSTTLVSGFYLDQLNKPAENQPPRKYAVVVGDTAAPAACGDIHP